MNACKRNIFFTIFLLHVTLLAQLPVKVQKVVTKAETAMSQHKYENALSILEKSYQKTPVQYRPEIEWKMEQCKFGIEAMQHPTCMIPVNLSENINSEWDEYHPTLTANSKEMLFTVRRPRDEQTVCKYCEQEEDIYSSLQSNGIWQPRNKLAYPVNTGNNEGSQSISPDGNYLFFTICSSNFGYGSCDIYWSKRVANGWSEPKNCGPAVNTKYWESQPTIALDGKTIYFTSNRPGGFGCSDIWKTEMLSEGVFSEPVNLGGMINTPFDEETPFIHFDQKTLYFSSDGHLGLGGKDLFYSKIEPDGTWSKPINLGYPINTYQDELGIFINANGNVAYFASDRIGGYGGLDIYCFELDESLRPEPTLINLNPSVNNEQIATDTGKFEHLAAGEIFILPNLFFEFAQSNLLPDSYPELQRLLAYLIKNETVKIEISGHTDSQGSASYNQKLSSDRAKTIYQYLIDHGIAPNRLSFKGYGKERPIVPNDSEENRAKNRRTEILILEK